LPAGVRYVEVVGGSDHSLARRSDGVTLGWGANLFGQLNVPPLPPPPSNLLYTQLSAGFAHSIALRSDGLIVAWGDNSQLQTAVPPLPAGLLYVEAAAGTSHNIARRSDGAVVAWGRHVEGQCLVPVLPAGVSYVGVAAGNAHSLALRSDGVVVAFGRNVEGQCSVPSLAPGESFVSVHASGDHSVARTVLLCTEVQIYCTGKVNSIGCQPVVASIGFARVGASSGFVVSGSNVRNNKSGLLFYGANGRSSAPFQGGTLCVNPPVKRTPSANSGGTAAPANDCSGVYAIDMNAFASGALGGSPLSALTVAGTVIDCQWWGRDPGFAAPNNTTLSNGLEFVMCP
jgi:hypothetical protein